MDELKALILGLKTEISNLRLVVEDLEERIEISAAPDIYDALRAIVNWYEVKGEVLCTNDQPYELLRQALRKAEGRTDRG